MKYKLKDAKLQRKLDEISGGDFSESLDRWGVCGGPFAIIIHPEVLELKDGYDPNDWNNYPEVTPPEGVLMRVECENNMHTALIFKDGAWQFESKEPFKGFTARFKVKRYRPWFGG